MAKEKTNEFNPNKLYYSISEVASYLDIAESNIRFWEKEFEAFIKPQRTARKGVRGFHKAAAYRQRQPPVHNEGHRGAKADKILGEGLWYDTRRRQQTPLEEPHRCGSQYGNRKPARRNKGNACGNKERNVKKAGSPAV